MKRFEVNAKSHFQHLWSLILLAVSMPIIGHYMMIQKRGGYTAERALLVGSIFFIVFIVPILILHINHYFQSKKSLFFYNGSQGRIIYSKYGKNLDFRLNDIYKITVYKSWSMAQGRTPTLPTDIYNYAVIELKDRQVLKISSLMVYELDKVVKFDNTEIKKKFYTWMN